MSLLLICVQFNTIYVQLWAQETHDVVAPNQQIATAKREFNKRILCALFVRKYIYVII